MSGRGSQGRGVGLNDSVAGTLSEGVWGRVVSSASDRLGNSRQFALGRVKGFRKSAFFSPLWQSPERLGSVCSVGFPRQIQADPRRAPLGEAGSPGRAAGAVVPVQRRAPAAARAGSPPGEGGSFLTPVGVSLTQGPYPGLGRAGRETGGGGGAARSGQPCPPWRGPPSRCHPAHCHGNRCSCSSKFPGGSAPGVRVPSPPQGPSSRPAAAGRTPKRPSPASTVCGQKSNFEAIPMPFSTGVKDGQGAGTPAANPLLLPPPPTLAGGTAGKGWRLAAVGCGTGRCSPELRRSRPSAPASPRAPRPCAHPRGCAQSCGTCSPGRVPPHPRDAGPVLLFRV